MGMFEVEGTTLLAWTTRLAATEEQRMRDEVERRLGSVREADGPGIGFGHHRITEWEPGSRVLGSSLVIWSRVVEAEGAAQAVDLGVRAGSCPVALPKGFALVDVRHRVSRCRELEGMSEPSTALARGRDCG
jgi:hypothetical protein